MAGGASKQDAATRRTAVRCEQKHGPFHSGTRRRHGLYRDGPSQHALGDAVEQQRVRSEVQYDGDGRVGSDRTASG